jgi:HD-GYP domain-containing protein (c-di-GMP phosphodiesterase class II)
VSEMARPVRLAELIGALSLATDLGLGQPMEYLLRTCLLAIEIGTELKLSAAELHDIYYTALLRWIGCSGHAHEASRLYGDEQAARARLALLDLGDPGAVLFDALVHIGEGRPLPSRLATLAAALSRGPRSEPEEQFRASCEVGRGLAGRLGLGAGVLAALWHAFERWDGNGFPNRVAGEHIALPMRVVVVAQDAVVFERVGGLEAVVTRARERSGKAYDPAVAQVVIDRAPALFERLNVSSAWDAALMVEPNPQTRVAGSELDQALEVFADFADLKSVYTGGHSRRVAALAASAGEAAGVSPTETRRIRRAGLVQDLGRLGVPNSIWDKPAPLTDTEWERVRLHPYYTSRMLARSEPLAELGALAASHHERVDGSGYHRGVGGSGLSRPERILAAADAYQAMSEPRAYRAPMKTEAGATELRAMARASLLDGHAVEAVLAAAGLRAELRRAWPAGLTAREVEVLRCAARGLLNKETARTLGISERTVGHHLQHIYDKIGVSTRGAAALFAMENELL